MSLQKLSYLKSANADYIDGLFAQYLQNPDSIDSSWRYFFDGLELGSEEISALQPNGQDGAVTTSSIDLSAEAKVAELITAYRELGLHLANLDPLNSPAASHPLLELSSFGLSELDLEKSFTAGKLIGVGPAKLKDIIAHLRQTYCSSIGIEFTHIEDPISREWLQKKMETSGNREKLDFETRKLILKRLTESETFERFLHTRYVAQKRFSIEGGESLIPALDCIIEVGTNLGAHEFVMGMAHRGRLNVLTNIYQKKPEHIFTEFEGNYKTHTSQGEGDVKYHMGYSADLNTRHGKPVHLSLANNPSHLEFVNPLVEGIARAKQSHHGDQERTKVIPVLIHGDAAFTGQGVCYETLNLSQLEGYKTGGTLHIVINNQIGFTTNPSDSRSTSYATDLAKMLEVPIFHVNGDDPEAIWYVAKLCMEYRQKFKKDVFIDLICYRKYGHNEGDEPSFTQPLMYKKIKTHLSVREIYAKKLSAEKVISEQEAQKIVEEVTARLSEAQARTKAEAPQPFVSVFQAKWQGLRRPEDADLFKTIQTAVDEKTLLEIAEKLNRIPSPFHLHSKLSRFFETRLKAIHEGKGIDWGNGEALAFGSLLWEGFPIRLSGQDAERGTFTHRHSVLHDVESGETYTPLNHLREGQAHYHVYNSNLSETGVLGFEYGFSLADPSVLVIWEAQFGDFANSAQVIIDQFIASSESKWQRMSGLVILLPHGYEGQGPEHSSARLERYLQLSGKNNWSICNFTTPAQLFHGLRRQLKRDFRKPLVIMSPKSLLRHPLAVSNLSEFTQGSFQEVLDDGELARTTQPSAVRRILLCSGKIYYDLLAERTHLNRTDIAILRLEQLYPWPAETLRKIFSQYSAAQEIFWVQEEPRNMGAWTYIFNHWYGGLENFQDLINRKPIHYIGREVGAAPAVGSAKTHEKDQKAIVEKALTK